MSKVIIVCGLAGSGKTTIAKSLSKKLRISCLHKDSIKETLYSSLSFESLEDSKRIGKPSIDILFSLAQNQIDNDVDIILEAPFNFREDYVLFKGWEEKPEISLHTVICEISPEIRETRFRTRKRNSAHHDEERNFDSLEDSSIFNEVPGKKVTINTQIDVPENINKIILWLGL